MGSLLFLLMLAASDERSWKADEMLILNANSLRG